MENNLNKPVVYDMIGLKESAKNCFPDLSEEEALTKLIAFVSWIISK